MSALFLVLNWGFGIFIGLIGLASLFSDLLTGLIILGISALLLPPIRRIVHEKTNISLTSKQRTIAIMALMIASIVSISMSEGRRGAIMAERQAEEQAKQAAAAKQRLIDEFTANKASIIASVKDAVDAKDYKKAANIAAKYEAARDADLVSLSAEAIKIDKTNQLEAALKATPVTEYGKLQEIYTQLSVLYPDNNDYKSNIALYQKKAADAAEEQRLAAERKKMIEAQFSAWDGSHRNLEKMIKNSMNDPDSYQHVETRYWDMKDHLVVITTFRGKNAFGGVVKNSVKAKVDLNGNVLKVLEQL